MIGKFKVLGIIPARGGSKGIPKKNIATVNGRPLISWTIDAAKGSKYLDRTIVSSDCEEIQIAAKQSGGEVPFTRPDKLATDTSAGIDPIIHALNMIPGYDIVVVLQPTSPLRMTEDIDNALEVLVDSGQASCVSVTRAPVHPNLIYFGGDDGKLKRCLSSEPVSRRQDEDIAYYLNGAVYASFASQVLDTHKLIDQDTVAYIMPESRSLDIDVMTDLEQFKSIVLKDYAREIR